MMVHTKLNKKKNQSSPKNRKTTVTTNPQSCDLANSLQALSPPTRKTPPYDSAMWITVGLTKQVTVNDFYPGL